ncbi:Aldo/keto reductase [Gloeophyllum trabeum ATCC 11539]|uniref:Aldo/keto reductase n=1 Tax=Gloeophyllum trabeum (strain ATCC 11539 / FP-39264 / Madison 617) TaxID=670483 RepID=S7R9S6_GLOTA|nr:Aldo/keto reductase [Gloeophyllum trabeum ATCC 11539]EPQ50985.1 Aldo/keto reductase [Gloeophyllum trabeum ATCC 11539]
MPFGNVKLNDGTEIPAIAFGTGSVWKGKDVTKYVEQAVETGFSHIDTAAIYKTESNVGQAIRETGLSRSDLYITTKYDGGDIQGAIRDSLALLGIKHVDLYLIHAPLFLPGSIEDGWREFEKIKESGLATSIGVSNFNLEELQKLVKSAKVIPAVNQIRFHPYNYAENKELLDYAAKHGIIIEAYSSLTPITKAPGGPVDKPVAAAAERLGATPVQVILKWVQQKGAVIVTTSSKKEHLEEYLAVADLPDLTDDEIAAIDEAGAKGPSDAKTKAKTALTFLLCGYLTLRALWQVSKLLELPLAR